MEVDRRLEFIRQLTLPDGRRLAETLPADPWLEERVLGPVFAQDGEGLPLHRLVYIELARGHFKTGSVAAVAMVEALSEPGTDVYAVAADLDQARLIIEAISGQCRRNRGLAAAFKQTKDVFEVRRSGSKIRVLSSDAPSAYGLAVNCRRLRVVCDELTQWPRPDLYHAMITTMPKVANSQLIIISNAGVGPGQAWQWGVREAAAATGYLYSAEGTIASWIRPDALAQIGASVPPPVFQRLYLNKWIEESGEFVPMELWDRGCDSRLPSLRGKESGDRTSLVVGVDAAVSGDCFGCVAVSRDPERHADAVAVRDVAIWAPPPGGLIDFNEPRA
jgi:hypothetical protein